MKSLVTYFVDRPLAVNLITVMICIFGLVTALGMSRTLQPPLTIKAVSVTASLPGASAVDMERFVTFRLEEALQDLRGLKELESTTRNGQAQLQLSFEPGHDDMVASVEQIKSQLAAIRHRLPRDIRPLDIEQQVMDRLYAPAMHLEGIDEGNPEHRRYVDSLTERLRRITGVVDVESSLRAQNLHIVFDNGALNRAGLNVVQARERVLEFLRYAPVGQIRSGDDELAILVDKGFESIDSLKSLPLVVNRAGQGLRLEQVAQVELRFAEERGRSTLRGAPFVSIQLWSRTGNDSILLTERVRALVDEFAAAPPEGVTLEVATDPSELIDHELAILQTNGLGGIVIVLVILLVFLGWRIAVMTALGLPFCYLGSLLLVDGASVDFNLISLAAMILVLGILVDDAIIVSEAFAARLKDGLSRRDAAIEAATQTLRPVTGMMLTTALAFSPLLIIDSALSSLIRPLPVVVIAALVLSFVESFLILPNHLKDFGPLSGAIEDRRFVVLARNAYGWVLAGVCKLRYLALPGFIALAVLAGWLVSEKMEVKTNLSLGSGLIIHAELKESISLEATEDALRPLEARLKELEPDLVKYFTTRLGSAMIRGNVMEGMRFAQIQVAPTGSMAEWPQKQLGISEKIQPLIDELVAQERFEKLYLMQSYADTGASQEVVSIYVSGNDRIPFGDIQDGIEEAIERVDGVQDVYMDDDRFQDSWSFVVNHRDVLSYGLSPEGIAAQLRQRVDGPELERIRLRGEELLVFTHYEGDLPLHKRELQRVTVMTPRGIAVPLSRLGRWEKLRTLRKIEHKNMLRVFKVDVVFDEQQASSDEVKDWIQASLEPLRERFPGYSITVHPDEGEAERKIWLIKLAVFTLGLIFLSLALSLNSLVEPLLVMVAVPFGFVGVILATWLHGMDLEVMGIIGVLGLTGVVVNDSLVVVDTIRRRREAEPDAPYRDLVLAGAKSRFQAVMLTSITTLGGVLPLAYGLGGDAGWIQPMVFALGWGLLFATLLTLFLLPSMLLIKDDLRRLGSWLWGRIRGTS